MLRWGCPPQPLEGAERRHRSVAVPHHHHSRRRHMCRSSNSSWTNFFRWAEAHRPRRRTKRFHSRPRRLQNQSRHSSHQYSHHSNHRSSSSHTAVSPLHTTRRRRYRCCAPFATVPCLARPAAPATAQPHTAALAAAAAAAAAAGVGGPDAIGRRCRRRITRRGSQRGPGQSQSLQAGTNLCPFYSHSCCHNAC